MKDKGAALVIHEDGDITEVDLSASDDHLATFYRELECDTVDLVRMTSSIDAWLDDEGLLTQRPFNQVFTALAKRFGWTYQPYVGPVLLAGHNDDGDSTNLTPEQIRAIATSLRDLLDSGAIRAEEEP